MFGLVAGLASFALQGASSIASYGAQKAAAKKNRESAFTAYRLNRADLAARSVQAQDAAHLDMFALGQEGQAAASTAAASAAENGVSGSSVHALLDTYLADASRAQEIVGRNLDITEQELSRRKESAGIEYKDRLAAVPDPSPFNLGLSLIGAGIQAAPQVAPYLRLGGGIKPVGQRLGNTTPSGGR